MTATYQDSLFSRALVVPEVTLGTTPSAAAYVLNVTSAAIRRNRTRKAPNVWTNSRRPHPSRIVAKEGALELVAPFQYDNLLPLHEAFFGAARAAAITVTGTDISFDDTTPGANVIERVANDLNVFGLARMVHVSGAGETTNNGWKGPVLVSAAGALTIPDGQIVAEAAGEAVTLTCVPLLDSDTEKSLTAMWHGVKLEYRRAMRAAKVDRWALDFQNEDYIAERFDLMGRDPVAVGSDIGSGTVAGYPKATRFMTEADDIKRIVIGSVTRGELSLKMSTLNFEAQNNRNKVVSLGNGGVPHDHIFGVLAAEFRGNAIADADALTLQEAIDADESLYAYVAVEDPAGNSLCILVPAAKAIGDLMPKESGNLVDFGDLAITAHDPAKDEDSDFYNSGSGPGFMLGAFFRPAP
jgi:hypothetical protein